MTDEQILALKAALYCVANTKADVIMIDKEFIHKQSIIDKLVDIIALEEARYNLK